MRKYQRGYVYESSGMEKKRNRAKNYRGSECKCFTPFVKLHHHDCPLVKKPCPVHGGTFDHPSKGRKKDSDAESEECMLLSFHPSIKTDGLFQPLLSSCDPNSQINSHYFSTKDSPKEIFKHRQSQTNPEELKPPSGNKYFVEKAKSYVSGKTNRMKKLKQCFHSPCNSIAQKTRSQTSMRLSDMSPDDAKRNRDASLSEAFGTLPRRRASDDTNIDPSWFRWNKLGSSDGERTSDPDLYDSDRFLAVARPCKKSNMLHPNMYEVRHLKGSSEIQFYKKKNKKSDWTSHFFTAPADSEYRVNYVTDTSTRKENVIPVEKKGANLSSPANDPDDRRRNSFSRKGKSFKDSTDTSDKSQTETSSSGSVYYTPFIFVPAGVEEKQLVKSDQKQALVPTSKKEIVEQPPPETLVPCEKVEEKPVEKIPQRSREPSAQVECVPEVRKTSSKTSGQTFVYEDGARGAPLSPLRRSIAEDTLNTKATQTTLCDPHTSKSLKSLGVGSSRISDTDKIGLSSRKTPSKTTTLDVDERRLLRSRNVSSRGFQTSDSLLVTKGVKRGDICLENKATQTQEKKFRDVEIEAVGAGVVRSVNTQTRPPGSTEPEVEVEREPEPETSARRGEHHSGESNVTFVKEDFNTAESKHAMETAPQYWQKSHSESELQAKKQEEDGIKNDTEDYTLYRCPCKVPPAKLPCTCTHPKLTTIFEPPDTERRQEEKRPRPSPAPAPAAAPAAAAAPAPASKPAVRTEAGSVSGVAPRSLARTTPGSVSERGHKIETKDESNNTSFYDLSELTNMINEHFEKMMRDPKRSRALRHYENRTDRGVMTDLEVNLCRKDAAVQTSFSVITKPPDQVTIQQSLLLDVANQTQNVLVCKACKKEISTVFIDVSTSVPEVRTKTVDAEIYCELIKVNPGRGVQVQTSPKNIKPHDFEKSVKPIDIVRKNCSPTPLPRRKISYHTTPDCNDIHNRIADFSPVKDCLPAKPVAAQRPKTSSSRERPSCVCPRPATRVPRPTIPDDCVLGSPAAPRPGTARPPSKTNHSAPSFPKDKPNCRNDRAAYPVSVSHHCSKEFLKSLESKVNKKHLKKGFYSDSSIDSAISSFQQKRNLEKESDPDDVLPVGKKIKSGEIDIFDFCQEKVSENCFVFGQHKKLHKDPNFRASLKEPKQHPKSDPKKKKNFVKAASSPTFHCSPSASTGNLRPAALSEQKLNSKKNAPQKGCSSCNLFASKSVVFRSADDDKTSRKLYECPLCKSFSYLKHPHRNRPLKAKPGSVSRRLSREDKTLAALSPNEDSLAADSDEEHTLSLEWNATATDSRNLEENTTGDECSADLPESLADYNQESQDGRRRDKHAAALSKAYGSYWYGFESEKQYVSGETEKFSHQVENEIEKSAIEEASEEDYE